MSTKLMRYDELVPCKFVMSIYVTPRMTRKQRELAKAQEKRFVHIDTLMEIISGEEMDKKLADKKFHDNLANILARSGS